MAFGFHREQWNELPPLTIHPCRNPLLPFGIYMHIYMNAVPPTCDRVRFAPALLQTFPSAYLYILHTNLPTGHPTNQDLSLLLVMMDGALIFSHHLAFINIHMYVYVSKWISICILDCKANLELCNNFFLKQIVRL